MTPTRWCARPRCPYPAGHTCRGLPPWRGATAGSFPSSIWTRWGTASDDRRRRRSTRRLPRRRPGFRVQHLSGRAHPALRGAGVPIVDLRKRLSCPAPLKDDTRTVVLEHDGAKIGVIVDQVTEVVQVAATDVAAPPSIVKGLAAEYITGLVVRDKRTLIVLNTGRLLTSKEKLGLDTAMETHAAGKEKAKAR